MTSSERPSATSRRGFLRAVALFAASLAIRPAQAQRTAAAGSVQDVRGEASATTAAGRRTLHQAAPVFVRDRIATGTRSRLAMRLGRDTTLRLGERVNLTIDRFLVDAGGEITLGSGSMLLDRPSRRTGARVRIRSPFGLIAVRGTRVFAGASKGVFGVFVERGSVSVTAAGRRVIVRAGQGIDIRRPGAPPTRPSRWQPARIRSALDSVL